MKRMEFLMFSKIKITSVGLVLIFFFTLSFSAIGASGAASGGSDGAGGGGFSEQDELEIIQIMMSANRLASPVIEMQVLRDLKQSQVVETVRLIVLSAQEIADVVHIIPLISKISGRVASRSSAEQKILVLNTSDYSHGYDFHIAVSGKQRNDLPLSTQATIRTFAVDGLQRLERLLGYLVVRPHTLIEVIREDRGRYTYTVNIKEDL